jgi:hypothetical protein
MDDLCLSSCGSAGVTQPIFICGVLFSEYRLEIVVAKALFYLRLSASLFYATIFICSAGSAETAKAAGSTTSTLTKL